MPVQIDRDEGTGFQMSATGAQDPDHSITHYRGQHVLRADLDNARPGLPEERRSPDPV